MFIEIREIKENEKIKKDNKGNEEGFKCIKSTTITPEQAEQFWDDLFREMFQNA